jgi:replicative superfamily II helicase
VAVSRLRYISSKLDKPPRFVGLAASISNYSDVADWLGVDRSKAFVYSAKSRPLSSKAEVKGFPQYHLAARLQAIRA